MKVEFFLLGKFKCFSLDYTKVKFNKQIEIFIGVITVLSIDLICLRRRGIEADLIVISVFT